MASGPLSARVAGLCVEVGHRLGGTTEAAVAEVRVRLGQPLRIAIAGRLKSGKSTLVNSLIGKRVAQTEVGECTRLVTQFRYGTSDRVDVVKRDGNRVSLPLDESGMIPQRLDVPRQEISFIDCTLTSDRLRDLTVIDTPGLSSTNTPISQESKRFLFDDDLDPDSRGALSGAEAIIYVFTHSVRADDLEALEAFRSVSARLSSNPINSLALFNKVDKLADGGDPWPVAEPLAASQADVLRRVVSDVVPVIGLLAETTEAGRLTAADCEALRTLARIPESERQVLLASVDLFTERRCPVGREQRQRLLRLLDLYGINFAVAALLAEPRLATGELVRRLFLASGFPRLRKTLDQVFRWRTDAIKAGWGLSALEKIASQAPRATDRELLRDAIERLVQQPEYHRLKLLEVAQLVSAGSVRLPERMEVEVTRLALSQDPEWILNMAGAPAPTLAQAALAAATRWRAFAVAGASPAQARVAHVVHRGFYLLSQQVRAGATRK